MRITIVGAGRVAHAVGSRWAKNAHEITFGVRDLQSQKVASLLADCGPTARACIVAATSWLASRTHA